MGQDRESRSKPTSQEVPWRLVWMALAISILGTALLGGVAFVADQNVWWIALAGVGSLLVGGAYLGARCEEAEPLYGSLLAILYFGLAVVILFGGTLTEELPEPLPGLAIGDSTFFFVAPLLMLTAGVVGSIFGGLRRRHRTEDGPNSSEGEHGV